MKVKFEGGKELEKALLQLKTATAKNTTRRAGKQALQTVIDEAKRRVPVDDGDLRDGLTVSTKASRGTRKRSDIEVYAGASGVNYASIVEFGSEDTAAQPFLRPAWDLRKTYVLKNFRASMSIEIEKATARARRKAEREARKLKR